MGGAALDQILYLPGECVPASFPPRDKAELVLDVNHAGRSCGGSYAAYTRTHKLLGCHKPIFAKVAFRKGLRQCSGIDLKKKMARGQRGDANNVAEDSRGSP